MHEMSYVVRFVNLALKTAEEHHASGVTRIVVQVGEMTDIVPEYLHKYYPEAVRGTILEGSELITETIPVMVTCRKCGQTYHPSRENQYLCPSCRSAQGSVIQGRGIKLKEVELQQN